MFHEALLPSPDMYLICVVQQAGELGPVSVRDIKYVNGNAGVLAMENKIPCVVLHPFYHHVIEVRDENRLPFELAGVQTELLILVGPVILDDGVPLFADAFVEAPSFILGRVKLHVPFTVGTDHKADLGDSRGQTFGVLFATLRTFEGQLHTIRLQIKTEMGTTFHVGDGHPGF